jgi:cell division protein FtsL
MRILHLIVIIVLVLAASYVYRIKLDSTVQAERVAKVRAEIRRERDTIASLRAEWAKLDNPSRIQKLAKRHLPLQPVAPTQVGGIETLPMRPPSLAPKDDDDLIAAMIQDLEDETTTGTLPNPETER